MPRDRFDRLVASEFVQSFGVVPGPGFRIRAFTIYQRRQQGLFAEKAS